MTDDLHRRTPLLVLSILAIALLLLSSVVGLVSDRGGNPYAFTSLRGEAVEVYGGTGLYQYDNSYKAVAFRSFDWVIVSLTSVGRIWSNLTALSQGARCQS
jgi:hypothetical protein